MQIALQHADRGHQHGLHEPYEKTTADTAASTGRYPVSADEACWLAMAL